MGFGHDDDPGIAPIRLDRDHASFRTERKRRSERRDGDIGRDGLHVAAHHPCNGEVAHPADVGGAANGLSAQMKPPSGERIAEHLPRDQNRDDDGDEHRGGELQVSRGLQRDEGHGQRRTDDRCGERAHADDGISTRIQDQAGPCRADAAREQMTADGAEQ